MSKIPPIDCTLYDHLEVACMFNYELEITQKNGSSVIGNAQTTKISAGAEFLVLKVNTETVDVPLHEIDKVSVITPNAKFSELQF